MSHHYSGPQLGFPCGDPRLDFCDLYAFPKPGGAASAAMSDLWGSLRSPGWPPLLPFSASRLGTQPR